MTVPVRLCSFVFWGAAALTLVLALVPHPPVLLHWDKAQHMLAFAVLTGLAALAFPRRRWQATTLGLLAFGAAIELLQAIPALHRDSDIRDWWADALAVAVVQLLVVSVRRLPERRAVRRIALGGSAANSFRSRENP